MLFAGLLLFISFHDDYRNQDDQYQPHHNQSPAAHHHHYYHHHRRRRHCRYHSLPAPPLRWRNTAEAPVAAFAQNVNVP